MWLKSRQPRYTSEKIVMKPVDISTWWHPECDSSQMRYRWRNLFHQITSAEISGSHGDEYVICCALMIEAVSTCETSVNFYQTTRRNILEDSCLHCDFWLWRITKDCTLPSHTSGLTGPRSQDMLATRPATGRIKISSKKCRLMLIK
jgi:hypothetical protein